MILDGAVIPADWCRENTISVQGKAIDLWYSGKAHTHGGNIQAVLALDGFPPWVSAAEPGSAHDATAARIHALPAMCRAAAAGLPTLADPATTVPASACTSRSGSPRRAGPRSQCPHPQCPAPLAALPQRTRLRPGHRPLAHLQHVTASPGKISDIARAALVLTHFE